MAVAIRTITRLQDADDAPALGAGQNGYALTWNNATAAFVATALPAAGVTDHGALTGLSDDDHAQYLKKAGDSMTGALTISASTTNLISATATITDNTSVNRDGFVFTTLMSPATDGTCNYRNVEYILQSGTTKEISSGTNFLAYHNINSYSSEVIGFRILSNYGANANIVNDKSLDIGQNNKTSGAAVANKYGLYVNNITHGNNNWAIYTNTGLVRFGDAIVLANGSIRPSANSTTALQLQNASGSSVLNVDTTNGRVGIGTTAPATRLDIDAGALTMNEMTAPTGVANKAMLYTKDNGSGKTQLCCKLGDDVEIVIATQA